MIQKLSHSRSQGPVIKETWTDGDVLESYAMYGMKLSQGEPNPPMHNIDLGCDIAVS